MVVAGGCDYYPGSATSSPGFSFTVLDLRLAGDGDLLARIERLRKQLDAEGLLETQKRLRMPVLPHTIGVVTGEGGKARDDVLAALARRGWAGRLVWAFAPVQDRHAAPAIVRALGELAAVGGVEVAIVARGGGSLADLLCFCDETLCRTVALLGVPVVASVGHHTDRTLLDDVAAVSCSTPTHAAEAAVGIDCTRARGEQTAAAARLRDHAGRAVLPRAGLAGAAARLREHGRRAVLTRARLLASSRGLPPPIWTASARTCTSSCARSAPARAGDSLRAARDRAQGVVLERKTASFLLDCRERRPRELSAARARARRPRSTAHARAGLRAGARSRRGPGRHGGRRARGGRAGAALRRRLGGGEGARAMSAPAEEPQGPRRPTRRRRRASRRSSADWTPARRASTRRWRSSARASC